MSIIQNAATLDSRRFNKEFGELFDDETFRNEYPFLHRTALVPAEDEEIIPFLPIVTNSTADIVYEDDKVLVYRRGQSEIPYTSIPSIRIGGSIPETGNFSRSAFVEKILRGLYDRLESLIIGVLCGSYRSPFGFEVEFWRNQIPAECLVTSATPWDHPAADAVDNVKSALQGGYDRMTISRRALYALTLNAGFLESSKVRREEILSFDVEELESLVKEVFELREVEVYRKKTWVKKAGETKRRMELFPGGDIIFTRIENDRNRDAFDFALGVTAESMFVNRYYESGTPADAEMLGTALRTVETLSESLPPETLRLGNPYFGPFCYYTAARKESNGQFGELRGWCVMRGFPRRFAPDYALRLRVF